MQTILTGPMGMTERQLPRVVLTESCASGARDAEASQDVNDEESERSEDSEEVNVLTEI